MAKTTKRVGREFQVIIRERDGKVEKDGGRRKEGERRIKRKDAWRTYEKAWRNSRGYC